jgi:hypothetical protein
MKTKMKIQNKRIQVSVSPELYDKLDGLAGRIGLNRNQLAVMSMQAGFDAIFRTMFPMEALGEKGLAGIMAEMAKTGQPIRLPDGTVIGSEEL